MVKKARHPKRSRRPVVKLGTASARDFFLKPRSYCSIDLPPYFHFEDLLQGVDAQLNGKRLKSMAGSPREHTGVNYELVSNKDGRLAWRPFQLIHPAIYVDLVNLITKPDNWKHIKKRFKHFAENPQIQCLSIAASEQEAVEAVGTDLITHFHYYRLVRNWTCHENAASRIDLLLERFREILPFSKNNVNLTTCDAPHEPEKLTFDDFVLYTRVVKKIADRLNTLATPNYERLIARFPLQRFRNRTTNPQRLRNAVCGHLRTEFGLDIASAEAIRDEIVVQ